MMSVPSLPANSAGSRQPLHSSSADTPAPFVFHYQERDIRPKRPAGFQSVLNRPVPPRRPQQLRVPRLLLPAPSYSIHEVHSEQTTESVQSVQPEQREQSEQPEQPAAAFTEGLRPPVLPLRLNTPVEPPRTPRPDAEEPEQPPPAELPHTLLLSSFGLTQLESGSFAAYVECPEHIALEITSRNYDQAVRNTIDLQRLVYEEAKFTVEATTQRAALLGALELRLRVMMISVMDLLPMQRMGEAEDLADVELTPDVEFKGEQKCAICLCELQLGQRVRRTPCLHLFHLECIQNWVRRRRVCPIDKYFLDC